MNNLISVNDRMPDLKLSDDNDHGIEQKNYYESDDLICQLIDGSYVVGHLYKCGRYKKDDYIAFFLSYGDRDQVLDVVAWRPLNEELNKKRVGNQEDGMIDGISQERDERLLRHFAQWSYDNSLAHITNDHIKEYIEDHMPKL